MKNGMNKRGSLTRRLLVSAASVALLAGGVSIVPTSTAVAQDYTTGTINGTIQDTSGGVIANATIAITSDRGLQRTLVADAEGKFRLPRMPIGTYHVTITKEGYNALEDQDILVKVGSSSVFTFTMATEGAYVEEVNVVGTRVSSWDFNNTTGGISIDVAELATQVPLGRDLTGIALLAPASTPGDESFNRGGRSQVSLSGSSVAENAFYMNGMNLTEFRNFLGSSAVPFEFLQQVEVKTGGYSAEFGRSTGGVVNSVSKSGTNEFHFGANFVYTPGFGREDGRSHHEGADQFDEFSEKDLTLWASGPIVKDKLFFYAMYNPRSVNQVSHPAIDLEDHTSDSSDFWATKIDFEPFEGHRFEATIFQNSQERARERFGFNAGESFVHDGGNFIRPIDGLEDISNSETLLGASQGTTVFRSGGVTRIFSYKGEITDWLNASVTYGVNPSNSTSFTDPDTSNLPRIIDSRDGGFTPFPGTAGQTAISVSEDRRELFRADVDVYANFMGEHHFRFGFDREKLESLDESRVSGGEYWRYFNCATPGGCIFPDGVVAEGDDYVRFWERTTGGSFNTIQSAFYVQDSWEVNEDLTITMGIRNEKFDNRNSENETFVKMTNQWAPRFGFSWDPFGDKRSRVFGSAGRFFLPVAANTNIRNAGAELFKLTYFNFDSIGSDFRPIVNGNTLNPSTEAAFWTRNISNGELPDPATRAQVGIKPMYQDEVTLGYEYQYDEDWTLSVRGTYRKLKRLIEDIGINAGLYAWGQRNGKSQEDLDCLVNPACHGIEYIIANPGTDLTVKTNYFTHGGELETVDLTAEELGYPKGSRTYKAVEFVADRAWDGKWMANIAYTLSSTKGNTEGAVNSDLGQDDAGLTQDFDLPATLLNANGSVANARTHKIKARGAYQVTDYLRVGAVLDVQSGRSFGCFGNLPVGTSVPGALPDNWAYNSRYGAAYWFCDGEPTPRGSQFKTPWSKRLDLSFTLTPSFNESIPGDVELSVEVFNVFNSRTANSIDFTREVARASAEAPLQTRPFFGEANGYTAPRFLRFAARYKF